MTHSSPTHRSPVLPPCAMHIFSPPCMHWAKVGRVWAVTTLGPPLPGSGPEAASGHFPHAAPLGTLLDSAEGTGAVRMPRRPPCEPRFGRPINCTGKPPRGDRLRRETKGKPAHEDGYGHHQAGQAG